MMMMVFTMLYSLAVCFFLITYLCTSPHLLLSIVYTACCAVLEESWHSGPLYHEQSPALTRLVCYLSATEQQQLLTTQHTRIDLVEPIFFSLAKARAALLHHTVSLSSSDIISSLSHTPSFYSARAPVARVLKRNIAKRTHSSLINHSPLCLDATAPSPPHHQPTLRICVPSYPARLWIRLS